MKAKTKFIVSVAFSVVWLAVSLLFARRWAEAVSEFLPAAYVWWVIFGIALLPGFLMSAMLVSNLLNRSLPRLRRTSMPVTILMSARNEEAGIARAIRSVFAQTYAGRIRLIVIDNGSTDGTARVVKNLCAEAPAGRTLELVFCRRAGKSNALNKGLAMVRTPYFLTLDADTVLEKTAVQNLMNHITARGSVCAAGNLFVGNGGSSVIASMQTYDYLLSIAAIKRYQGSYGSTLVAQGAFSAYETCAVREAGGWEECMGEDIVLTYRLLSTGRTSSYEPRAVAYTDVPESLGGFFRQRKRWAMGMFEGLAAVPPRRQPSFYARWFTRVNLAVIALDLAYVTGFIPGVILALCGHPWFVGILTLLMLAVNAAIYFTLYRFQRSLGIPFARPLGGFLLFLFFFQPLQSTAALAGYIAHLSGRGRVW